MVPALGAGGRDVMVKNGNGNGSDNGSGRKNQWTADQCRELRSLWMDGAELPDLMAHFEKSRPAVLSQAHRQGLGRRVRINGRLTVVLEGQSRGKPPGNVKNRKCNVCREPFPAKDFIFTCPSCKQGRQVEGSMAEEYSTRIFADIC
jgi:hypothetical protein